MKKRNGHLPLWECHMPWGLLSAFPLSHSSSSLCCTLLLALFCSTTLVAIVLRVLLVLCCSWVLGILGAQELNTFWGCLLEILTDWADCLPWTPISVNRGAQRALKMGLTLLELLPMVVPRNLWEKTLKLHKVSYLPCIPIWDRQTG